MIATYFGKSIVTLGGTSVGPSRVPLIQICRRGFMHIAPFGSAVLLFSAVGCSSTNISNCDPFYDYVGKTVELRRPVAVVARSSVWSGGDGVLSLRPARYGIVDARNRGPYRKVYAQLPVGHAVRIEKVRDEVAFDVQHIIAYGRTTIPPRNKEVRFAYPWGALWQLERAPWEPDDTPPRRVASGRLPPHFDYDIFRPDPDLPKWGTKVKQ